ncbi:hypothetical protein FRC11_007501 [Ceratobasidium sp. 423]|nr:hypothetical protein FRC11_007501 [Ceratobasidium sp. 423]
MTGSLISTTDDDDKNYIFCELCREPLQELSVEDRQTHYEAHFNNGDGLGVNELNAQLAASIAMQGSSPSRGVVAPAIHSNAQRVIAPQKPRENVFWHSACGSPAPGRIVTPGIIPILGRALERPGSGGGALCSPLVAHYGTELWDLGWRPSAAVHKAGLKVHASGVSSINSNTLPHSQQHHGSPTKAKDFFKRVIKRRSRSRIDEQEPKRVRGGTAEADDWEALGRGKGHKLSGFGVGDQNHKGPGPSKAINPSSHTKGEIKSAEENIDLLATLQDLDLGRLLSTYRVTPSQLSKKDQYQILWFPMTAPLTGLERDARKVVRSERVTVSPAPTS